MFTILLSLPTITHAQQRDLNNGTYQFQIHRPDGHNIVFNAIVKDSAEKKVMVLINGSNRLLADSILFRHDSVYIELPFFESGFVAKIKHNGDLEGDWVKRSADTERRMHFSAKYGEKTRFEVNTKPLYDISGRWQVAFGTGASVSNSVGEFTQNGTYLTGTFLTPYGDYRFLEGVVNGDRLYLSGFDGSYALLFTGHIKDNQTIVEGEWYSGMKVSESWKAEKNSKAALPDGYEMTKIIDETQKLRFTFPDLDENQVSMNDDRFKDKVVVVQIMGSWCPNCMDETQFLVDNYANYHAKGVEFLGMAFERTDNYEKSRTALAPFKKNFKPPYPILIPPVAVSDPLMTKKTFPQLDKIKAFPTTIFVGKDGLIKKVEGGFNGPATGVHYDAYKKEFAEVIQQLLNEE